MTKTPEELTEDWKAGKLASGLYYVGNDKVKDFAFVKPHEIAVYTLDDNIPKILKRGVQILAPVPTYDEYKAMQEQIADASKTIEDMKDRIVNLLIDLSSSISDNPERGYWQAPRVAKRVLGAFITW